MPPLLDSLAYLAASRGSLDLVTILPIKPNGGSEMVVNLFFHSLNKYISQMYNCSLEFGEKKKTWRAITLKRCGKFSFFFAFQKLTDDIILLNIYVRKSYKFSN